MLSVAPAVSSMGLSTVERLFLQRNGNQGRFADGAGTSWARLAQAGERLHQMPASTLDIRHVDGLL